jgi:Fe-S cluster assembly protein SufB
MPQNEAIKGIGLDEYKYGFVTEEKPVFKAKKGLSEDIVRQISAHKEEPEWMLEFRLKALEIFYSKPLPDWGGDVASLDLDEIYYYLKPQDHMERSWDDVPDEIKTTFERLGIPEAERKILAGVGAQFESEMVYHSLKEEWTEQGIIFESIEDGLKLYPEIFREHFATIVPPQDNKYAALNSAVWSGGSFVYIPKGVPQALP